MKKYETDNTITYIFREIFSKNRIFKKFLHARNIKMRFSEVESMYQAANSTPQLALKPKIKYLLSRLYKMYLHIEYFSSHESTVSLMKPILMRIEKHLATYAKAETKLSRK